MTEQGVRILVRLSLAATMAMAAPAAARDLPDLIISKSRLAATGDCSGRQPLISGSADVTNTGQGRGQIFTTKEMIRSHVVGRPDIRGADRFVNSMRPGETVTVEIRVGQGQRHNIVGRHTVELEVDPVGVFEEENEHNNTVKIEIEVKCN